MKKRIAVFGSAIIGDSAAAFRQAETIGEIIGRCGLDILCGGYGGVMEAVCKGCQKTGGVCYGIGFKHFTHSPNSYIDHFEAVATLGERLDYFDKNADIYLALSGGIGTVTEVMYFWDIAKAGLCAKTPLLVLGSEWHALLEVLKNKYIIKETAFELIKKLKNTEELTQHLESIRTQGL